MNIEYQINHHKRIIFSLLRKYNIRYDTDEYAQLLTIKMWNLIRQFDTSIHDSMSRYLFQRLHFYLVDIFRKKSRQLNTCTLETTLNETKRCPMISQTSFPLIVNDYYHLLNEQERIWLNLKLYGYKQFEIQQLMNKSATTIRKYQNCVRSKLEPLRTFIKGGSFMHDTKTHPIILYMANYPHQCFQVECVYNIFRKLTKNSIKHYLNLLARMYPLPKNVVSTELKQVLNIRKHLPIVINDATILFPIKHKRAQMQYFINGMQITGIKKENQQTRLIFTNGKHLVIKAPYNFIHRKWLECIFLHHFIFIGHD